MASRVKVYNNDLLESLLEGSSRLDTKEESHLRPRLAERSLTESIMSSDVSAMRRQRLLERKRQLDLEEQRRRRYEQHKVEARRQQVAGERRVKASVTLNRLKREELYQHHTSQLLEGNELVEKLKASIDLHDQANQNKSRRQFDDWNREVYGKIQHRISEQLDSMDHRALNGRKNAEFQQFLDATNSKGAIFRDIIIESEYDPLEPNRHSIKVASADVHDPCSRAVDKIIEEKSMLASPTEAKAMKKPKTREVLHVSEWATGKIEATPHGFFAKIMSEKDSSTKDKTQLSGTWKSALPFDHYCIPTGKEVTDVEFPRGKRTKPHAYKSSFSINDSH